MPNVLFPWDRDFQIEILALATQRYDFLLTVTEIVRPEYFEDVILQWFFKCIETYHETYQQAPTPAVLKNELQSDLNRRKIKIHQADEYKSVLDALLRPVNAQQYTMDTVVQFCRRQEGRRIYLETAPLMDTADDEDWDRILEKLWTIRDIGGTAIDRGLNYFEEVDERVKDRLTGDKRKTASTHIIGYHPETPSTSIDLDHLISGGLKSGQLGIWMGGTNIGKSIALNHCTAAAVQDGYRVIQYTLELDSKDIAARHDAQYAKVAYQEVAAKSKTIQQAIYANRTRFQADYGSEDRLYIKHYPTGTASVNTIKNNLRQHASNGWYPDVIVVDYMDLLKPLTKYNNEYSDLGAIAVALRGLAGELDIPIWTATQVNRSGLVAEIVDVEHIGDSLKKAQIADVIIAICATREEMKNNVLRLFIAKNRNGPGKRLLHIRSGYAQMEFYDCTKSPISPSSVPPPPKKKANPSSYKPPASLPKAVVKKRSSRRKPKAN